MSKSNAYAQVPQPIVECHCDRDGERIEDSVCRFEHGTVISISSQVDGYFFVQ